MMETMTDEYVDYMADSGSSADQIVAGFHAIDERVNAMREQRLNDPDSLGDKLIKYLIPTLAGLVAGRLFQALWNRGTSRTAKAAAGEDAQQGLLMSVLFAGASAAFGAILTTLADRGPRRSSIADTAGTAEPPAGTGRRRTGLVFRNMCLVADSQPNTYCSQPYTDVRQAMFAAPQTAYERCR